MTDCIKIQIPASSSNLGAGFDCFGLALDLYNEYIFNFTSSGFKANSNLDENIFVNNKKNLVFKSFSHLYKKLCKNKMPGIDLELKAQIPSCGGFGSSSTAVLAGLLAANKFLGNKLSVEEILLEAANIEGHADNVCASMLGAFCLVSFFNNKLHYKKINWNLDLKILMLYPENFRVNTNEARKVIQKKQKLENCIFNIANAALFTSAVLTNDLDTFQKSVQDKIHEEARLNLIPNATEIIDFANNNNAIAATISGSGASLIVFVKDTKDAEIIENYAKEKWLEKDIVSKSLKCRVSNSGALVY